MLSDDTGQDHAAAGVALDHLSGSQALLIAGLLSRKLPSGFADLAACGDPIRLAFAYIAFIGLRSSREKAIAFPWISDIVGAAALLLAMALGSVLLLGRRSGETSVLPIRRQRPTWGGRDDGKRPGQAGADNRFQPGESIYLLTVWLISVDLAANAPRERRKGYSVRSDGGDEARCGLCCMTTVRR